MLQEMAGMRKKSRHEDENERGQQGVGAQTSARNLAHIFSIPGGHGGGPSGGPPM